MIITAYAQGNSHRAAYEVTFDHFFTKPLDFKVITGVLASTSRNLRDSRRCLLFPNEDGLESNEDGLESAKPDLQSAFKKPGA